MQFISQRQHMKISSQGVIQQQSEQQYSQQQQQHYASQQKQMNVQNKQKQQSLLLNLPFIVKRYTKQQRQQERSNRPKLGLRRLTDDKKIVSIDIDIPFDQNTIIKEKFDWDLNKDKISPTDFSRQLVSILNLSPEYVDKIKQQILSQIMQHIKINTKQKPIEEILHNIQTQNYNKNIQAIRFNNHQYQQDQIDKEQNQKKKMSRMRRKQLQRGQNLNVQQQPIRYFKEKKICRNCKNQNATPGYQCKYCKLPFQIMEQLNIQDKRIKISVKYYEKISNKIPLLVYEAKKKHFQKQDFDSFYKIYNKIKSIFQNSDQLSKQNLNQVKYIMQKYHEYFLNGQLDFNDEEIIYEKDNKKDLKEDQNRPKRQRGRPRKIKIINDDLQPDSINNTNNNKDQSSSGQLYQSSQSS